MFTTYIVMFIVMAVLQGFYLIYNLFYESKDLIHYLPLPFTGSEVFTAKLAVLALLMLPYLIPVLSLFLLLGQDAGQPILITIIISFFFVSVTNSSDHFLFCDFGPSDYKTSSVQKK